MFHIQLGSFQLLETAFVTLLNLGEFDFVLGSCRKEGAGPGGKLYQFRNEMWSRIYLSSNLMEHGKFPLKLRLVKFETAELFFVNVLMEMHFLKFSNAY